MRSFLGRLGTIAEILQVGSSLAGQAMRGRNRARLASPPAQ
jgi:hypothetical protein